MKKVLIAVTVCATGFLGFFFFVPIVWTDLNPCIIYPIASPSSGYGYTSLSYRLFGFGVTYIFGQIAWSPQPTVCP